MVIYYVVLLVMTMFGSVASLFLKKASGSKSLIDMLKNINNEAVINTKGLDPASAGSITNGDLNV